MEERFKRIKEYYAAGLFEETDSSLFRRFSRGMRRYLENCRLPEYSGEPLYPSGIFVEYFRDGGEGMDVHPHFCTTVEVFWGELEKKDKIATSALRDFLAPMHSVIPREHTIGGDLYTHSFPNFERIVREGLNSYEMRVNDSENTDIRLGLLDVLQGIRSFHKRSLEYLESVGADSKLTDALKKVPFEPANTLYEAIVCRNFIYYMDGCDNIGHLDAELIDYYKGEDMTEVFRCLFSNIDLNNGWSGALGPDCNAITQQCLKAIKGMRRPSLELRVTDDTPSYIWELAVDSIKSGGGSPSLYNEDVYQKSLSLNFPEIPKSDLMRFCGGGCTETMLAGVSNVGSLDAGINLALIFERFMRNHLENSESFEMFYEDFIRIADEEIKGVLEAVNRSREIRAKERPQPMRTLLIDDCIDSGKDFNNGGARYAWSVINIAGMINVIDSLLVIKKIVFEDGILEGNEFLKALDSGEDFRGYHGIERHGYDSENANIMASRLSNDICGIFEEIKPYLDSKFLPSSIQFTTYVDAGKSVGATPDGRKAHDPLCDSVGALSGNAKYGLTAVLNSASSLCQDKMLGTPVLNVTIDSRHTTEIVKSLAMSYFQSGGMQMQFSCIDRNKYEDAIINPDKYPDLIVRIGGYSEYFNRLTPELKQTVIDRDCSL